MTVNLTTRADLACEEAIKVTGDNRTDVVNRALVFYAEHLKAIQAGGASYLRPTEGGELERCLLL